MTAPLPGTLVKVRGLVNLAWLPRGETATIGWDRAAAEMVDAGYLEIVEVLPIDPGNPYPTVAELAAAVAAAEAARDAAQASEAAAASSAQTSQDAADLAATTAAGIESIAEDVAQVAADKAAAEAARDDAQAAASAASGSASAASGSASAAAGSASSASSSASTATSAAGDAEDAASAAAASASNASGHATTATTQASNASGSASAASGSAASASASATDAQYWAEQAVDVVNDGIPNATTTIKGGIILAGDLAGTYDAPTVPALAAKADLVGGVVPTSQLPAIALTEAHPVANQAAMLALTGVQPGDLAVRADGAGTFVLIDADPSQLSSWLLLNSPTDVVVSVNGQTGTVVLDNTDVGAAPASHTHPATAISDSTSVGRGVLTAASKSSARTAIDAGTSNLVLGTDAGTACEGNDTRLSDTRTPTTGTVPYDVTFVARTGTRAVGAGDVPAGIKLRRAVVFSEVTFRCETADASGNLVVELRKNGVAVSGTSTTIAAANQVAGGTSSGTWSFAAGDVLTVQVTGVGTTPGKGLVADIKGLC